MMRLLMFFLVLVPNTFATPLTASFSASWSEVDFSATLIAYSEFKGVQDTKVYTTPPASFQNYLNKFPTTEIESLVEEPIGFGNIRNFSSALVNLDGVAEVGVGAANFGAGFAFTTFDWLLLNTNQFLPSESLILTLNIPESGVYIYNGLGFNPNGDDAPYASVIATIRWSGSSIEQLDDDTIFRIAYDSKGDVTTIEGDELKTKLIFPTANSIRGGIQGEPFTTTRNFGVIPPGGTLRIIYNLFAEGDLATGETGFEALIGDPAQLVGGSAIISPAGSEVPEPGTAAIMAASLLVSLSSVKRIHAFTHTRNPSRLDSAQ